MMKVTGTSVVLLLSAGAACADDRPNIWTGAYIGAQIGQTWGKTSVNCARGCGKPVGVSVSGQTYGGTLGYNWQVSNHIVLGVEGDVSFSDVEGDRFFQGKAFGHMGMHSELQSAGSFRGRAGFLVSPTIMIYATGGVAVGQWGDRMVGWVGKREWTQTYTGWTAGGGVEMFVAKDLTIKAEYLYTDYGSDLKPWTTGALKFESNTHTARVGMNYKLW